MIGRIGARVQDGTVSAAIVAGNHRTGAEKLLPKSVTHAVGWAFALRIADRGFGLVRTLVLARLLAPSDFGLFGIALIALSAVEMLSQTGVHSALVQRQGDITRSLDTAWTIQVIRGVVLAGAMWLGSGPIAAFFGEPLAVGLVRAMAVASLFQGIMNIGVVHFHKDMRFEKRFAYMFAGTMADVLVGIVAALILRSAWALVYGMLAGSVVRTIASFVVHPYRPRLHWDTGEARALYTFGRWVFGSSGAIFLITQGDDIMVGKLLGVAALGFYQMAYLLSNLPATQITHLVSEVALPLYSRLHGDAVRLRRAFFAILRSITLITLPLAGAIAVFADDIVQVALGAAWQPAVAVIPILALLGGLRAIGAANGALFTGTGTPRHDAVVAGIHLTLMAVCIYPLAKFGGLAGVAVAVTAPMIVSQAYGVSRAVRVIGCSTLDYARCTAPAVAGTTFAIAVVSVAQSLPAGTSALWGGLLAASVYAAVAGGVLHWQGVGYDQVIGVLRGGGHGV